MRFADLMSRRRSDLDVGNWAWAITGEQRSEENETYRYHELVYPCVQREDTVSRGTHTHYRPRHPRRPGL